MSADRVTFLDARTLLNGFLVHAEPDAGGLRATIGKVIGELAELAGPGPVYVFGDMTGEFWREGHAEAAVALEDAWNDLAAEQTLFLLCGYDAVLMAREGAGTFDDVCRRHAHVLPGRRFAARDSDNVWLEVARLEDQVRRLSHVQGQCEDLTALVEAATDGRERLLNAGSHELRNPVHALRLQLQAALRALSAPLADIQTVRLRVERAEAQALKLSRILDTALSPASFSRSSLDLSADDAADWSVTLRRSVAAFADERHDVTVTTAIDDDLGSCEQTRVGQAIRHLLNHVGNVTRTTTIHVVAVAEPHAVRTRVENGIGRSMGDPTALVPSELVRPESRGGSLWMTRQLVEAMGGTLVVATRPDGPMTYEITWPRRAAQGIGSVSR